MLLPKATISAPVTPAGLSQDVPEATPAPPVGTAAFLSQLSGQWPETPCSGPSGGRAALGEAEAARGPASLPPFVWADRGPCPAEAWAGRGLGKQGSGMVMMTDAVSLGLTQEVPERPIPRPTQLPVFKEQRPEGRKPLPPGVTPWREGAAEPQAVLQGCQSGAQKPAACDWGRTGRAPGPRATCSYCIL